MSSEQRYASVLLVSFLFALPLLACSDGGGSTNDGSGADSGTPDANPDAGADAGETDGSADAPDRVEYTLATGAILLDDALVAGLQPVEGSGEVLVFDALATGVEDIAVNTVLVSGLTDATPRGLLRRVTAIENDGTTLTLQTEQAALTAAFSALDADVTLELQNAQVDWSVGNQAVDQQKDSGGESFGGQYDWIVFDGDDDPFTVDDQVRISGELSASASYEFGLSYDLGVLDDILELDFPPDFDSFDIDLRVGLGAEARATIDLLLSGRAALGFQKKVEIGRTYLTPIGAGPLVFLPVIRAVAGVTGSVPGSFEIRFAEEAGFAAGASYSFDDGFQTVWEPPYATNTAASADVELGASARAYVDIEIDFLLYGIVGPKGGLSIYAEAEGNVFSEPCWRAAAGLEAFLGLRLELFTVELVDWDKRWPIVETEIGTGSCETGEAVDPPPPFSRGWNESVSVLYGSDSAFTDVEPAIDGTWLIGGRSVTSLIKMDRQGTPVWARALIEEAVLPTPVAFNAVITRPDGGIAAATERGLLVQLDAAGHFQSAVELDTASEADAVPSDIVADGAGGYWISTTHSPLDGQPGDVALIHYTAEGEVTAQAWGVDGAYETPWDLFWWNDELWLLVAQTDYSLPNPSTAWLLRFSASGEMIDQTHITTCGNGDTVVLRTALVTESNRLVLGGYHGFSSTRALLLNIDESRTIDWTSSHSPTAIIGFDVSSITQLEGGALLVAGQRLYAAPDDIFVARTDSIGRMLWLQRIGGTSWEAGATVVQQGDGNGLLVGGTTSLVELESGLFASTFDVRTGEMSLRGDAPLTTSAEAYTVDEVCMATEVVTDRPARPLPVVLTPAIVREVVSETEPMQLSE
jgi:hypothetical protein